LVFERNLNHCSFILSWCS